MPPKLSIDVDSEEDFSESNADFKQYLATPRNIPSSTLPVAVASSSKHEKKKKLDLSYPWEWSRVVVFDIDPSSAKKGDQPKMILIPSAEKVTETELINTTLLESDYNVYKGFEKGLSDNKLFERWSKMCERRTVYKETKKNFALAKFTQWDDLKLESKKLQESMKHFSASLTTDMEVVDFSRYPMSLTPATFREPFSSVFIGLTIEKMIKLGPDQGNTYFLPEQARVYSYPPDTPRYIYNANQEKSYNIGNILLERESKVVPVQFLMSQWHTQAIDKIRALIWDDLPDMERDLDEFEVNTLFLSIFVPEPRRVEEKKKKKDPDDDEHEQKKIVVNHIDSSLFDISYGYLISLCHLANRAGVSLNDANRNTIALKEVLNKKHTHETLLYPIWSESDSDRSDKTNIRHSFENESLMHVFTDLNAASLHAYKTEDEAFGKDTADFSNLDEAQRKKTLEIGTVQRTQTPQISWIHSRLREFDLLEDEKRAARSPSPSPPSTPKAVRSSKKNEPKSPSSPTSPSSPKKTIDSYNVVGMSSHSIPFSPSMFFHPYGPSCKNQEHYNQILQAQKMAHLITQAYNKARHPYHRAVQSQITHVPAIDLIRLAANMLQCMNDLHARLEEYAQDFKSKFEEIKETDRKTRVLSRNKIALYERLRFGVPKDHLLKSMRLCYMILQPFMFNIPSERGSKKNPGGLESPESMMSRTFEDMHNRCTEFLNNCPAIRDWKSDQVFKDMAIARNQELEQAALLLNKPLIFANIQERIRELEERYGSRNFAQDVRLEESLERVAMRDDWIYSKHFEELIEEENERLAEEMLEEDSHMKMKDAIKKIEQKREQDFVMAATRAWQESMASKAKEAKKSRGGGGGGGEKEKKEKKAGLEQESMDSLERPNTWIAAKVRQLKIAYVKGLYKRKYGHNPKIMVDAKQLDEELLKTQKLNMVKLLLSTRKSTYEWFFWKGIKEKKMEEKKKKKKFLESSSDEDDTAISIPRDFVAVYDAVKHMNGEQIEAYVSSMDRDTFKDHYHKMNALRQCLDGAQDECKRSINYDYLGSTVHANNRTDGKIGWDAVKMREAWHDVRWTACANSIKAKHQDADSHFLVSLFAVEPTMILERFAFLQQYEKQNLVKQKLFLPFEVKKVPYLTLRLTKVHGQSFHSLTMKSTMLPTLTSILNLDLLSPESETEYVVHKTTSSRDDDEKRRGTKTSNKSEHIVLATENVDEQRRILASFNTGGGGGGGGGGRNYTSKKK